MSQYLNVFPSLKYRGRNFSELQVDGMGWLDEMCYLLALPGWTNIPHLLVRFPNWLESQLGAQYPKNMGPPPICHFVSDHWRQRICSIFQLDFSYFYVSHLCAPLIWHFDAAHFEQHRICSNFSLQAASDLFQFFNVPICICGQGLFHICSHHDFRFYRALQFVLRMFSN